MTQAGTTVLWSGAVSVCSVRSRRIPATGQGQLTGNRWLALLSCCQPVHRSCLLSNQRHLHCLPATVTVNFPRACTCNTVFKLNCLAQCRMTLFQVLTLSGPIDSQVCLIWYFNFLMMTEQLLSAIELPGRDCLVARLECQSTCV